MGGICETYGALWGGIIHKFIWKPECYIPRGINKRRSEKIIK